ncbi:MAG: hypothetical protein ABJ349_03685 [Hyphomicrobiales bacterium]
MNLPNLKLFARRHWLPIGGFVLSLGIAVWFGFTFLADAIYFNDPRHKDAALERWMTPRYVVLSYELPRSVVAEVLELTSEDEGKRRRLGKIAERMDLTLDELTQKVREAAQTYRETQE